MKNSSDVQEVALSNAVILWKVKMILLHLWML